MWLHFIFFCSFQLLFPKITYTQKEITSLGISQFDWLFLSVSQSKFSGSRKFTLKYQ